MNTLVAQTTIWLKTKYSDTKLQFTSHNHPYFQVSIDNIAEQVFSWSWVFSPSQEFFIEGGRKLNSYYFEDHVAIRLLIEYLKTILCNQLCWNYFQKKGAGRVKASKELVRNLRSNKYVYKTDVYSYYAQICHLRLYEKLSEVLGKQLVCFVLSCLRVEKYKRLRLRGIPLGNSVSYLIAEFYLRELDQHFASRSSEYHYQRYNDDIIILTRSKRSLKSGGKSDSSDFKKKWVTCLK